MNRQQIVRTRAITEALEGRQLLSAAWMNNGVLFVEGTYFNDQIIVRQLNNQITVSGVRGSVPQSAVRAIAIDGNSGNDRIILSNPNLEGGVQYIYKPCFISGGDGNDLIVGGAGNDLILGGFGQDTIYGLWGNDIIAAGSGHDWADGGAGNDYIAGQDGYDTLFGSDGNDWIDGGNNFDSLSGGAGNNVLADDFGGASVAANRVGVDRTAVRMPMVSVSGLQSTPVRDLGSITPAWRQNTFLYNALGPDLYNDILVNKTVPSSFGWL